MDTSYQYSPRWLTHRHRGHTSGMRTWVCPSWCSSGSSSSSCSPGGRRTGRWQSPERERIMKKTHKYMFYFTTLNSSLSSSLSKKKAWMIRSPRGLMASSGILSKSFGGGKERTYKNKLPQLEICLLSNYPQELLLKLTMDKCSTLIDFKCKHNHFGKYSPGVAIISDIKCTWRCRYPLLPTSNFLNLGINRNSESWYSPVPDFLLFHPTLWLSLVWPWFFLGFFTQPSSDIFR